MRHAERWQHAWRPTRYWNIVLVLSETVLGIVIEPWELKFGVLNSEFSAENRFLDSWG